jgi:phage head maturation protease
MFERQITGLRAVPGEGNERSFRLSFSSEDPYMRWFGLEILDHGEGAVDLSRLNEIGVLLFNHNPDRVVGAVAKAWLDDRRGEAQVTFDEDSDAELNFQKVQKGTLKGASVRYVVDIWEEVAAGKQSTDGRYTGPCWIARKWTVYEISIVSIPADATVGVGRQMEIQKEENRNMDPETTIEQLPKAAEPASERAAVQPAVPTVDAEQVRVAERARVTEITDICRSFDLSPDEHIRSGRSVDEVRKQVVEHLKENKKPVSGSVEGGVDETEKIRAAARDGLLLRGGLPVEKPAPGANEFRSMRLRDLGIFTLQRDGRRVDQTISDDDLMRQFFTPGASFPAILDQTVNLAYMLGYAHAPATFDVWTQKGTLSDFKPTKGYYQGGAGDFIKVPENGELKHDIPVDNLAPSRQLETYGRQFTLSRQTFINDDIGFITSVPARYAAAAKRTINKQVYTILAGNAAHTDGVNVFDATRYNYVASGTAPALTSLQEMIKLLALQKDPAGEPLAFIPRYVLVPVGLGDPVRQIIASTTIAVNVGGVITAQNNPLVNRGLEVVEEAYLNILGDAIEWYLVADKSSATFVQVDYLNGQEIPTIRRMETPGVLGFIWDIILDWSVTVLEPKAAVKNEGHA